MIRKSIEKGTSVFHEAFGYGKFLEWNPWDVTGNFAHIHFEDGTHNIHRKRLTEIEEEP